MEREPSPHRTREEVRGDLKKAVHEDIIESFKNAYFLMEKPETYKVGERLRILTRQHALEFGFNARLLAREARKGLQQELKPSESSRRDSLR